MTTPTPPAGFVPENNLPAPPPGFVPESQAGNSIPRQIGLTARALAGGAAQVVEPFTEPVRYLMNKALPGNPIGNIETATDELLTNVGVPEPQGAVEEGVQSVGRFVTGFGGGGKIADVAEEVTMKALGLARKTVRMDAPTSGQLKEIANTAYRAADEAGLVINPRSFARFSDDVAGVARNAGIDRDIHPKATAAIRRIQEVVDDGKPITLQEFDILRRVVAGARASIDADERRIGSIIADKMDDYLNALGRADVAAGDSQKATSALNVARDAWRRMSKSAMIEDAIYNAGISAKQYSGSGFENAIRVQFRQLAKNKKKMRGFSPKEKEAIRRVAMGGKLDNAFRMLGKLAPTGVISGGISGGVGYQLGGIPGAVALPALGAASRRAATSLTQRNVERAHELVRAGAPIEKDAPEWLLPWLSGAMFGVDTQGN